MAVNGDQEPLVELESAGELLRELPRALQHLINDGRRLFGVSGQVVVSGHQQKDRSLQTSSPRIQSRCSRSKPVSELVSK